MVEYNIIKHADTQLTNYFSKFTPVALFVGATNGIGKNTINQFAKQTRAASTRPRVYFVGRSRERGEQLKEELLAINPNGVYEFFPADLTLLAEVDEVCRKIREKEKSLNLLFMSQGSFEPATGMISLFVFI
jgi:short-subunit dehydrogenase